MTLFIQAVRNIKKDIIVHILTVLQLAAVIVIAATTVSSILLGYKYYAPFSDILRSNGIFCDFLLRANTSYIDPVQCIADNEMKNLFPEIENVISCNRGYGMLSDNEGNFIGAQSDQILYDDEVIKRYRPEIKEGRWLNTSENAECVEAVVTENDLGIEVGDKIKMSFYAFEEGDVLQDVLVVGKIADNTRVVGYNNSLEGDASFNSLYGTASFEIEEITIFFMSSNYLSDNTTIIQGIFGPALITFSEDCSDERIEEIRQEISGYNCDISYLLSDVNKNSMSIIYSRLGDLLPIIIVLLIMIMVSGISSSALAARREMKSFAIFYITGLQWRHCGLISLIGSSILALFSAVLSAAAILIIKSTAVGADITIMFRWQTVLAAAAIIAFFILISMIMPMIMLSRTTPKQILTR